MGRIASTLQPPAALLSNQGGLLRAPLKPSEVKT